MPRLSLPFLLCLITNALFAQSYFHGEIDYTVTYESKNNSAAVTQLPSYPAKQFRTIFENGTWIQHWDTAAYVEYQYFDQKSNRLYWKINGLDTLFYENAGEGRKRPEESLVSTQILHGTDRVLGRVCDRFVLRLRSMTLTFIYDPTIKIDPAWFKAAKINYYDLVFGAIHSIYLKMIWEMSTFKVTTTATRLTSRMVQPSDFPAIGQWPIALMGQ